MSKRREALLLLAILLLFPAYVTFGTGQGEKATEVKKISIWDQANDPGPSEALDTLIAEFETRNPGVKVERQPMDMENIRSGMKTAIASGAGPDIVGSSIGAYVWPAIEADLFLDLTEEYKNRGWDKRLQPWTRAYTSFKGHYWAVPNEAEVVSVVFYHQDIFKEKGLSVPKVWDDFIVLAEKLKAEGYDPAISNPAAVARGAFNMHYEAMMHGVAINQDLLEDTIFKKGNWNRPEFIKALKLLKVLNDRQLWPKDVNAMQWAEALTLFVSKKSALHLNGTWTLGSLTEDPNVQLDFFAPPPIPGVKGRVAINTGSGWLVSSESKYPKVALDFLDLVISAEGDKIWLEKSYWVPPTAIDTGKITLNRLQKKVLDLTLQPVAAYSMFNVMPEDVVQATIAKMQEMWLGKATPEEVMATKQKVWETAISEGRFPQK